VGSAEAIETTDFEVSKMASRDLGQVYLTGADGFIRSHLTEMLLALGHRVTALCVYNSEGRYGWLEKLAAQPPKNLRLIHGDVRDRYFMENSIAGHDTVFHLASLIAIPYSYLAPQSYFETNAMGSMNVAHAVLKNKVSRLIHTSTSEVYGTARVVPITEDHPLQGQSPYSASKIAADMIIESFHRSFNLPAVTLRPFNTYGPRQSLRAVIPTVIAQAVKGSDIKLGSTTPTRDFNYVTDTAAAFVAVGQAQDELVLGKTFNAGSGREISIGDLVQLIGQVIKKDVRIVCEDERLRPEASEVFRLLADATKLQQATGWKPKVSLEDGLAQVVAWLKENAPTKSTDIYHV